MQFIIWWDRGGKNHSLTVVNNFQLYRCRVKNWSTFPFQNMSEILSRTLERCNCIYFKFLTFRKMWNYLEHLTFILKLEDQCNKCSPCLDYWVLKFNISKTFGRSFGVLLGWDISKVLSEHLKESIGVKAEIENKYWKYKEE